MDNQLKIGDTVKIKPWGTIHKIVGNGLAPDCWWLDGGTGNYFKHLCERVIQ